jgi:carbamoyltransferase
MIVLGLNCFHGGSSAALIRDGELVAAAEEERFRRVRHWAGFPSQSITFCLAEAGITLSDVDHVAVLSASCTTSWYNVPIHAWSRLKNR